MLLNCFDANCKSVPRLRIILRRVVWHYDDRKRSRSAEQNMMTTYQQLIDIKISSIAWSCRYIYHYIVPSLVRWVNHRCRWDRFSLFRSRTNVVADIIDHRWMDDEHNEGRWWRTMMMAMTIRGIDNANMNQQNNNDNECMNTINVIRSMTFIQLSLIHLLSSRSISPSILMLVSTWVRSRVNSSIASCWSTVLASSKSTCKRIACNFWSERTDTTDGDDKLYANRYQDRRYDRMRIVMMVRMALILR